MKKPGESSVAQFSYTKVLIFFVTLVAYSTKSVTAAASMPEEAVGRPPDLNARSASFASLPVQRYLRSTSDKISHYEERAGWTSYQAALVSKLQTGWTGLKPLPTRMMKWLRMKRWDIAFTYWKLHKQEPMTLFENPIFLKFVGLVESKYPGNIDKQADRIYVVLASHYKPDKLVDILAVGMDSKKKTLAGLMLTAQVTSWIDKKIPGQEVFELLKLGKINDGKLFAGQAFSQFTSFIARSYDRPESYDVLYEMLYFNYGDSMWRLLKESKSVNPSPAVTDLLTRR
ncbi:hypothetical protein DD237_004014 [Peronospora effusa]|uniref:RxLR effector protein n=1 Tax=Peronospora effusa TaxID=542832 RepID=A0A3R8CWM0_9STRA|nr:hypothetical protein DD237_004014 [Peronospora effusa]